MRAATPETSDPEASGPETDDHATPDQVTDDEFQFKTKPALAVDILTDLHGAGALPPWATGDEVYGRDKALRAFYEDHDAGYVFGVPCSFTIQLNSHLKTRADKALKLCRARSKPTRIMTRSRSAAAVKDGARTTTDNGIR